MKNRDNQQTNSFRIGWIVGILEGEGWFILDKMWNWNKKWHIYKPMIGMNNTDETIIKQTDDILTEWKVGHHITKRNMKYPWKDQWQLIIFGMKRCTSLLEIILPYMSAKKKQAQLLMDFIEYRETKTSHDRHGKVETAFYEKLKGLNRKGKVSTTKH